MNQSRNYKGRCFCGAVEFTLGGDPEVMAYCHCGSCQHWSGGQVYAFTIWQADGLDITKGADKLGAFDKTAAAENKVGFSNRKWCTTCGGHVYIDHPTIGVVDVPAVLVEGLNFEPSFHIHYQDTVHRMKDGLPKFKDAPSAAGGSGEELPE
jgi:hypothetical protein